MVEVQERSEGGIGETRAKTRGETQDEIQEETQLERRRRSE